jgi:hypothetical protein
MSNADDIVPGETTMEFKVTVKETEGGLKFIEKDTMKAYWVKELKDFKTVNQMAKHPKCIVSYGVLASRIRVLGKGKVTAFTTPWECMTCPTFSKKGGKGLSGKKARTCDSEAIDKFHALFR